MGWVFTFYIFMFCNELFFFNRHGRAAGLRASPPKKTHLDVILLPLLELAVAEPEEQGFELGHLGADGVVHEVEGVLVRLERPLGFLVTGVVHGIHGLEAGDVHGGRGLRVQAVEAGDAASRGWAGGRHRPRMRICGLSASVLRSCE